MLLLVGASALQVVGANLDPVSCFFALKLITAPYFGRYEERIKPAIDKAIDADEHLYFLTRGMDVPRVFKRGEAKRKVLEAS